MDSSSEPKPENSGTGQAGQEPRQAPPSIPQPGPVGHPGNPSPVNSPGLAQNQTQSTAQHPPGQEDAAYQSASKAAEGVKSDPDHHEQPAGYYYKKKSKWGRLLLIVLIILLVAGLVAGAAYYLNKQKKDNAAKAKTQAQQQAASAEPQVSEEEALASVPTQKYTSATFHLTFEYPNNWTLDDSSSSKLSLNSPITKLTDVTGNTVNGKITIMFRAKGTTLTEFDKGNAVAARDSEKITYTKPTPSQRAQTYLTFLRYAGSKSVTGEMDAVYVTGDNGYTDGQAVPKADIAPVDPIITVTFGKCSDQGCAAPTAVGVAVTSWEKPMLQAVKKTLESLSVN